MAEQRVQRRLAAILAADVVGYSRLIEADEEGTRARLRSLLAELIEPRITADGGRIVKTSGDEILVEFGSAVDAVRNALDIQGVMRRRNADLPEEIRIEFRVGINVGDVIVEEDDIHGDGVNIAARLEELCEPGAVYASGTVYDQAAGKLAASFEDLGEQTVKNIDKPVRVYRTWAQSGEVANTADMAEPLPSADKPSIAVLPLENMSGDPEQEYFVDGICEDIITALSRIRQFFVIARNSTFQYKGTSPDIRDVANNLGVRYVLEGSVRKAGDQLRITAQLIDGDTGNHIWAERYDRKLEDIFAVQDEITQTVVGAIEPELGRAEYERMKAKPPGNLNAWEAFHRGMILVSRKSKDGNVEARKLFRQSIELDAGFAPAHAAVAWSLAQDIYFQHFDHDPDECLGIARRAVELDDKDPFSHFALGWALTYVKQPQDAIDSMRKAIAINPSYAHAHAILGRLLAHTGKAEEALRQVEIASTFSPADPNKGLWLNVVAVSNLYLGKHEDAIRWAKACTQTVDNWPPWMVVVSAAGHLGDAKQIEEARNELRARQPAISIDYVRDN